MDRCRMTFVSLIYFLREKNQTTFAEEVFLLPVMLLNSECKKYILRIIEKSQKLNKHTAKWLKNIVNFYSFSF